MSTMLIRHRVKDFAASRPIYEDHASARRQNGISDVSLHRDDGDQDMVTVVLKTDDLGRAREFMTDPNVKETMDCAGVISEPEIWFTNDA
jgi:hypothetical protein